MNGCCGRIVMAFQSDSLRAVLKEIDPARVAPPTLQEAMAYRSLQLQEELLSTAKDTNRLLDRIYGRVGG